MAGGTLWRGPFVLYFCVSVSTFERIDRWRRPESRQALGPIAGPDFVLHFSNSVGDPLYRAYDGSPDSRCDFSTRDYSRTRVSLKLYLFENHLARVDRRFAADCFFPGQGGHRMRFQRYVVFGG